MFFLRNQLQEIQLHKFSVYITRPIASGYQGEYVILPLDKFSRANPKSKPQEQTLRGFVRCRLQIILANPFFINYHKENKSYNKLRGTK
uniref:Uncharacterized protein n=1 Tax=Moorena producens (strain JHB) TaxID=1454205 RepID=A0A1D9FZT7_MOOP1